ncbi:hypothetical protein ACHAP5_008808 [Fusarium lateritium]
MGEIAKTLVSINGPQSVHSIIPIALLEYRCDGLRLHGHVPEEATFSRSTVIKDILARKKLMKAEIPAGGPGSGFIGLSGGFGTKEEIFEMTSWIQLGIHTRGIVLLNIEGYGDGILQWLDKAIDEGFITSGNKYLLAVVENAKGSMKALREYRGSSTVFQLQWEINRQGTRIM